MLVIACGALAREILALRDGPLGAFDVTCLPAQAAQPARDASPRPCAARSAPTAPTTTKSSASTAIAAPAASSTACWREEGVARIAGPHCYAFYAGEADFDAMMEEELGTFFLTDFLARHFERLVIEGLGLDRFPQLRDDYFGHYRRLVYLAQTDDADARRQGGGGGGAARARLRAALHRAWRARRTFSARARRQRRAWPT